MKFQLDPKPLFIRPEILCDPPLPTGLHRVNPRSIKGKVWWDIVREEAYKKNNYCCWACGVHVSDAMFHFRLEAHERFEYRYGYRSGSASLKEVCALCYACHNFIHAGRLKVLARSGTISADAYRTINAHGYGILRDHKLKHKVHPPRVGKYGWPGWVLNFEGKKYKSPFKTYTQYKLFFKRVGTKE